MGKFNSSKETLMRKSPALVAILYHDAKINLDSILNILQKKRNKILIEVRAPSNVTGIGRDSAPAVFRAFDGQSYESKKAEGPGFVGCPQRFWVSAPAVPKGALTYPSAAASSNQ